MTDNRQPTTDDLPVNLTVAGFDPSGGGGLQADLRIFTALQTQGLSVATAITSQNSREVSSVFPLPPKIVADQLKSLARDFSISSIKIGMVYTETTVEVLADSLKEISYNKLIIDPVLSSKRGFPLASGRAVSLMKERLFPLADLVTPNLEEAALLAGLPELEDERMIKKAAGIIGDNGPEFVLIKGGHGTGDLVEDWLYDGRSFRQFGHSRIKNQSGESVSCRGTGCALSSAIAAYLSRGVEMEEAVEKGIHFVQEAINNSYRVGSGYRMLGEGLVS